MGYTIAIGRLERWEYDGSRNHWLVVDENVPVCAPEIVRGYSADNSTRPSYTGWKYTMDLAGLREWWEGKRDEDEVNRVRVTKRDVEAVESAIALVRARQASGHLGPCRPPGEARIDPDAPVYVQASDLDAWRKVPTEHASPDSYQIAIERLSWLAYWMRYARRHYGRAAWMTT